MTFKDRYEAGREKLLNDKAICKENRDLLKKFYEFEEHKLKRMNRLRQLDESSYKTLYNYIHRLRNVNKWFKNKAWGILTKKEIASVLNGLEDGKIKTKEGKPFKDLNKSYYFSILKGKPFELAKKKEVVEEIMREQYFNTNNNDKDVKFIEEDTFRKIVDVTIKPKQKCLLWLAWDIGENVGSLLQLKKKDCTPQTNKDTGEREYLVNFQKEILKRSRTARSELTNFPETAKFLDIILESKESEDLLFDFQIKQAQKFLKRACKLVRAKCIPNGETMTWKVLRSSMACNLLEKGWHTDEINSRLGHTPSSRALDRYINFKAKKGYKPKKKIYMSNLKELQLEVEKSKGREKLLTRRYEDLKEDRDTATKKIAKLDQNDKIVAEKLVKLLNFFRSNPQKTKQLAGEKELREIFS